MKKGFVSFFIIIGMFVLIAFSLVMVFSSELKTALSGAQDLEGKAAHNFITTCLGDRAEDGLRLLGAQDAHINVDQAHYDDQGTKIVYYNNTTEFPDLDDVKQELTEFVKTYLPVCADDYMKASTDNITLKNATLDIYFGTQTTTIEIRDIFLKKNDWLEEESFNIHMQLPVRYRTVHTIADAILESRKRYPYLTEYIQELQNYTGIDIAWARLDDYDLYLIEDSMSEVDYDKYLFTLLIQVA